MCDIANGLSAQQSSKASYLKRNLRPPGSESSSAKNIVAGISSGGISFVGRSTRQTKAFAVGWYRLKLWTTAKIPARRLQVPIIRRTGSIGSGCAIEINYTGLACGVSARSRKAPSRCLDIEKIGIAILNSRNL